MTASVCLVTPAHGRLALSEVAFAEFAWLRQELKGRVDLGVVVVACDANLDLARQHGFRTVERDNDWLGRRFNDGLERACFDGFDYACPVGSDSWLHPDYLTGGPLPKDGTILTGDRQSVFSPDGLSRADLVIPYLDRSGVGPYVIPRRVLARCDYRPLEDRLHRGCDASTVAGLRRSNPGLWFDRRNLSAFQYTAFKSTSEQLNGYQQLIRAYKPVEIVGAPSMALREHYPGFLVDRLDAFHAALQPVAA